MKLFFPCSGVVLGYVVNAFQLRQWDPGDRLSSRNATRFFAGVRIGVDARLDILRAAAHALLESGVLHPMPPIHADLAEAFTARGPEGEGPEVAWLAAITADWDAIAGASCSPPPPVSSVRLAGYAALQMVVVDLSLRLAALLSLRGAPDGPSLPLYWFRPRGMQDWLRGLMHDASLSRGDLAKRTGVDRGLVDLWLAGGRPCDARSRAPPRGRAGSRAQCRRVRRSAPSPALPPLLV